MRATLEIPHVGAAWYEQALEGLVRLDQAELSGASYPPLYDAGVKYKREPKEVWRPASIVLKDGWGDCEDLVAWRVAECRLQGDAATARVYQAGPKTWHTVVEHADGTIEDPSRILGMGKDSEMAGVRHTIGADSNPGYRSISWSVKKDANGWSGELRLPLSGTGVAIKTKSSGAKTKDAAIKNALTSASKLLDKPEVNALIPTEARLVLQAVRSPQARKVLKGAADAVKKLF